MTDSMNFGPEWLRNLSSDGSTSGVGGGSGVGSRPQLADYRYGREEMLTLFTKGLRPPSSLTTYPMLYANTAQGQLPLALTPVTEDERGGGSQGVWSLSGGGSSIRGSSTVGGGSSTGIRGGGRSASLVGTGRGGIVGRGGSRGGSTSGGGGGWIPTNHNGSNADVTEWSPRKEYISGGGSYRSQSLVTDNWRKGTRPEAGGMDGDGGPVSGLMQPGQGAGQEAWRQGQQIRPGERIVSVNTSEQPPPQRWVQRSTSWRDGDPSNIAGSTNASRGPQQRRVWDEDNNHHHQQQLPEWALEQVSEPGGGTPVAGSFDATGAFHGELHKSTSQQNIGSSRDKVALPLATSRSALSLAKSPGGNNNTTQGSSSIGIINQEQPTDDTRQSDDTSAKETNRPALEQTTMQQRQPNVDRGNSVEQLINGSVNGVALNKTTPFENSNVNKVIDRGDEDFDRLQEDLVLKLVVDEEPSTNNGLALARGSGVGVGVVKHVQQPPPPNLLPPQADKWFYQDPQGDLQGPFMARDMAEWYGAGYFSVALLVRRGCDERFFRLGDLVALSQGGNPFQVRPLIQPPPLLLRDSREQHQNVEQQQTSGPPPVAVVNGPVASGPSAGPAPMLPDHPDLLQLQILQQQIAYRQHSAAQHQAHQQQFNSPPPVQVQPNHRSSIVDASPAAWVSSMQQRDLLTQQLLQQQQQQQQQIPPNNTFMQMISQLQKQQGVAKGGLIDPQQVPVQVIPASLQQQQPPTQPPANHPPSTNLNPLEALIAQMGSLKSPITQQLAPLHPTDHPQSQPSSSHQQQTIASAPAQSNPLLDLLRMKQQQQQRVPPMQVQQQQPPAAATQLEQLAMWQKNHHLQQHMQHQQQQQQWRMLQPQGSQGQGMQQDQSVGLWDVSAPSTQTTPSTAIASVINQQLPLSHHPSPSLPTQQHLLQHQQQQQQQITPTPQVQQPSTLPSDTQTHVPIPVPPVQQEGVTTPSKKKKVAASDAIPVEKKKDEEKQKKRELAKKQDNEKRQSVSGIDEKQRKKEEEKAARSKEEKTKQRESDERKAKEHDLKRKAKEQRKIDEENKRKAEEQKRLEDIERERQAARERDSEHVRRQQETLEVDETPPQSPQQPKVHSPAPAAPWLLSTAISPAATHSKPNPQANNLSPPPATTNLADIQRAEREKRAADQQQQMAAAAAAAALYQQQQQLLQLEREQQESGKAFSWASKPLKVEKVKSLAEIQAEEHELFVKKQAEDQRIAAIKEKEAAAVPTAGIWSGQSLTWASENISAHNIGGFWDETPRPQKLQLIGGQQVNSRANPQPAAKQLSSTGKPLTGNIISVAKKSQQVQAVTNRDTSGAKNNNNNNDSTDEFSNWCSKMLANMNANVDVPTFIGFLRDIESAFDVREYCRDYLGESGATQQFAAQFLEKRRQFKPNRTVAHKDDMCAPAPALTPNHYAGGVATGIASVAGAASGSYALREPSGNNVISMDFQEVKSKGKKVKKSKMLKVDSRILGFSVTAAPDRFNVGDRDYGDTT